MVEIEFLARFNGLTDWRLKPVLSEPGAVATGFRAAKAKTEKDVKTPYGTLLEVDHAVNDVAMGRETRKAS